MALRMLCTLTTFYATSTRIRKKMQYAMHCNLVILHGRLFPINASHTQALRSLYSILRIFFSLGVVHEKVSIACFHQTAKDMIFSSLLLLFFVVVDFVPIAIAVAFPNGFTSICYMHTHTNKNK